ncbi:MAG: DUF4175 family protein [Bacteroidia bacterium]|nr:DUF4175 family protein [Bacteroidia bacterium]
MTQHQVALDQQMREFRRKYYVDKIIRGTLILALLASSMVLVALWGEGIFGFSSGVRTAIVFGLGTVLIGVGGYMVLWPVSQLMMIAPGINDVQVANLVQKLFPQISDKLLNLLQLRALADQENILAWAAMDRKAAEIVPVKISTGINLSLNRKYLWYLLVPVVMFMLSYVINPDWMAASGHRLIHYNKQFIPPPPFQLTISGVPEQVVAGDRLEMTVTATGDQLPGELFVYIHDTSRPDAAFMDYTLVRESPTTFTYVFPEVRDDIQFYVGNPDARTATQNIKVLKRPFIKNFKLRVQPPAYTRLPEQVLNENIGDIKLLRGSVLTWELTPQGAVTDVWLMAHKTRRLPFVRNADDKPFLLSQRMMEDMTYYMSLQSPDQILNQDTVTYRVSVMPDRYPSIYVLSPSNEFKINLDTQMPLDLEIGDDYGFTRMTLFYRFTRSGGATAVTQDYKAYDLSLDPAILLQPQSYLIDLTLLGLREGDEMEYFIKVWDNDGIASPKATTSSVFKVIYPTLDARYEEAEQAQREVKKDVEALKDKSDELEEAYRKMQEKLLEQRKLSFDDRREVERMLKEHQQMMEDMQRTQEQFEQNKEKLQENQMISEQTLEKYEELNKFMEDLQNEEIKKMLEELQEKMESITPEDMRQKLDQLRMNDEDLRKSLERTLELMKQLEVQQKVDELINKVDNLENKQNMLNEKLQKADKPEELQNLSDRQEDLSKQAEELQKDLDELAEMKEKTETPDADAMSDLKQDAEQAESSMDEASEELEKSAESSASEAKGSKKAGQQSKQQAGESQKQAQQKLQEMSDQLSNMQMESMQSQDSQNLEHLRELLENLLKLSFDQEDLRNEVQSLKQGDPVLVEKGQQQKKLQDDMRLVQDSLESLANKVFQIQKFVLDESKAINRHMAESQTYFRNKQVQRVNFHQQSAMTSINNLANMLSEVMQQVQQQMMNAKSGNGMCQKPGGQKPQMQGMSQKQQELNRMMREMMQSGQMDGQKLSEMAAQQEAIRKQLQEAHEKIKQEGGQSLGDAEKIMEDMKQSEQEMVNKQLTAETLMRQQQILSRLLQAERSVRERELDEKRESRTATLGERTSPEELDIESYKNRIRQELLKTNKLEYSSDFIILIEQYFKMLEGSDE